MHDPGCRMKMMKTKSYRDLEIFILARELAIKVHKMTLEDLPKFEMYEQGSQIRRSSKSIVSCIVEGFGRRRYKNDFVLYLTYALSSCDETKVHLEMLRESGSLNRTTATALLEKYEELGAKLYNFRDSVLVGHRTT